MRRYPNINDYHSPVSRGKGNLNNSLLYTSCDTKMVRERVQKYFPCSGYDLLFPPAKPTKDRGRLHVSFEKSQHSGPELKIVMNAGIERQTTENSPTSSYRSKDLLSFIQTSKDASQSPPRTKKLFSNKKNEETLYLEPIFSKRMHIKDLKSRQKTRQKKTMFIQNNVNSILRSKDILSWQSSIYVQPQYQTNHTTYTQEDLFPWQPQNEQHKADYIIQEEMEPIVSTGRAKGIFKPAYVMKNIAELDQSKKSRRLNTMFEFKKLTE